MTTARSKPALPELSAPTKRAIRVVLVAAAAVGLLIGLGAFRLHLTTDPLADVHAYYDAGARLNAGLPLYEQQATTNDAEFYRYPPLLAILFRPLALLPFEIAAAIWMLTLVAASVATVWRLLRDRSTFTVLLALGMLAMPILWTLAVGQAQALVTLFLTIATPLGVALAGYIKLTPWLAGVYWVARGDRAAIVRLLAWIVAIGLVQLVLEPAATIAFLRFVSFEQIGEVVNLSPWAVSPLLWVVVVGSLFLVAWRLAPTQWGWAAAVVLAVGAPPRLLGYQLSTILAALAKPPTPVEEPVEQVGSREAFPSA